MRVLVTGAKGFIGSWLTPELESAGHEVIGVDHADGYLEIDGQFAEMLEEHRPDTVVHLAAKYGRLKGEVDPAFEGTRLDAGTSMGVTFNYDFNAKAKSLSGPLGAPESARFDHGVLADFRIDGATGCRVTTGQAAFVVPDRVSRMVVLAMQMVRGAMNAFVNLDSAEARRIIAMDKTVDQYNRDIIAELQMTMQKQPDSVPPALHCFSAVRHIERIADHATNIAEDVIYLAEGDIVRHRRMSDAPASA